MQEFFLKIAQTVNTYLSDYILIFLLIGVGLLFSVKTGFVQIRCFGEGMKKVFGNIKLKGGKQKSGLTSFQALATAIAAQVGTGNIVGASGAILIGGPGAIFWMWIIAFFGMATIYSEAVLAQKTRTVNPDGSIEGGPVYYIKTAFKGKFGKFLAGFFAVSAILALGFMGSMVQSNSIGESCNTAFGIPTWIVGAVIALVCVFIFIGGINRIASVTEKLVPIMAILFIAGGIVVLAARIKFIPETFGMIFKYAFRPDALLGGSVGAAIKIAISQGAKRGLFSNEAGMGSTPHAHALANVRRPHDQGVVAMIGVFIDTFVVLTFTALVVISTLYAGDGPLAQSYDKVAYVNESHEIIKTVDINEFNSEIDYAINNENNASFADSVDKSSYSGYKDAKSVIVNDAGEITGKLQKTNLAQWAFSGIFGTNIGSAFVAVCLLFFAFSTIVGWNLFGRINFNYLFGKKLTVVYSVISIAFIFLGSILSNDLVWELTDMFNNLMVIPNAIALVALCAIVGKEAKEAIAEKKANKQ